VFVLGRDHGCTESLLDYYDLPYELYGQCGTSKRSLLRELPEQFARAVTKSRRYDPDCIFGRGAYAAVAGAFTRAPVVLVDDSDNTDLDHAISVPLADAVLTPHTFEKDLGEKHYEFSGFKELAYLHPDEYEPQTNVREELGVGPTEEYAIVRLNAFGSHHDVGEVGFTPEKRRQLVETLSEYATVFVSEEGDDVDFESIPARPFDLHPAFLHDALAEASLLVADTQTMVTEAALLGTPAVRSNSFVGDDDMGNFRELEREGLVYNFREFEAVLEAATDLLASEDADERWRAIRDDYLADKVNLTSVLLDVAERVPTEDGIDRVGGVTSRATSRALPFDPAIRSDGGSR
jgi:predicted glycosyltransferase